MYSVGKELQCQVTGTMGCPRGKGSATRMSSQAKAARLAGLLYYQTVLGITRKSSKHTTEQVVLSSPAQANEQNKIFLFCNRFCFYILLRRHNLPPALEIIPFFSKTKEGPPSLYK